MRIKLRIEPANEIISLPVQYNHIVQSMIYSNLDCLFANWLHNQGYDYKKRIFKLFTFSKLFCSKREFDPKNRRITFYGPFYLKIASVNSKLLESLASHLIKSQYVKLNGNICFITSIEVEAPVEYRAPALIKAISPIVTYSTLIDVSGKKKTYYFSPFEQEFQEKILDNLKRKWIALHKTKDAPSLEGAYIKPKKVTNRNQVIAIFKEQTVIKGWTGVYELNLPEPYFYLAYDSGLGSKNSQGFGMFEVIGNKV